MIINAFKQHIALSFQAFIITIGDELLIGQTIDTNSAYIARELNKLGINVQSRIAIADNATAIGEALDDTIPRADIIFLTGGLGPTADDITKPTLAAYFNMPLVTDEKILVHIRHLFAHVNRVPLPGNLKQAEVPAGCQVLFNRLGTAPGMWFEKDDCIIISLPGVPMEMKSILHDETLHRLENQFRGSVIIHKTMITLARGESNIAEKIKDIEASLPSHIHLAYLPAPGLVKLRLTSSSTGIGKEELEKETGYWQEAIYQRLGNIVIAALEDLAPEEIIARLMESKKMSLGLAESCTGGYIAHKITDVPGSSSFFKGCIVSYHNQVKSDLLGVPDSVLQTNGAVSEQTVVQMAEEARRILDTDIALSVSGILGPGGGSPDKPVGLVWMAVADQQRTIARSFNLIYDRVHNKEMAAHLGFNLIRLFVNGDL